MKRNGPACRQAGFTLIEIMIAIAIIAVLSTVGLVIYSKAVSKGRDGKRIADLEEVKLAFVQYRTVNNGKICLNQITDPSTTNCLWRGNFSNPVVGDPGSFPNGNMTAIFVPKYLQKIPHDPIYKGNKFSDYGLSVTSEGTQFYLSSRLDSPPSNPQCNISAALIIPITWGHNYCITE